MTEVNRAQIDYWNHAGASRWVAHQERIDRSFQEIDVAVLARAAAASGERVIDVGCGCGGSTLALGARVGPRGSVLGVDVSAPMLARARERAANLPFVRFTEADAATHRFEPDADLLYSRFGVMFFDDPARAFTNLRGALRSSGRVCFVCWRSAAENPWYTVPVAAAERVLGPLPPSPPNAPSPFALADKERVHALLTGAGFRAVQLEAHDCDIELSTVGMEEALEYAVNAGPVARQLENADPAVRAPVRQEIERALLPYARDNTIALRAAVWIVSAQR